MHGGAFTGGSGTVPLYDGEEICRKGIVYITINYRLGVFGFLAHPELTAESPLKTSGNYGILDQIEALKWISRNIAADYLKAFPASNDEDVKKYRKITSVLSFGWQNYNWAKMQSTTGTGKAYLYYFTRIPPGEPNYGAFHSAEFGYALKTLKLWERPFTQIDRDLEEKMSSYCESSL